MADKRNLLKISSEKTGKEHYVRFDKNEKVFTNSWNKPILCGHCIQELMGTDNDVPYGARGKFQKQAEKVGLENNAQLMYDGNRVYCPRCNQEWTIIEDWEFYKKQEEEREARRIEMQKKARENVHLVFYNQSWSSGLKYYKLSARIDHDDWLKVKHLFHFANYSWDDEENDTLTGERLYGWVTTQPEKVEDALGIPEELRLVAREEKVRQRKERKDYALNVFNNSLDSIKNYFEEAEIPKGDFVLEGERVDNPRFPQNIYGGGQWFVLQEEEGYIWYVHNNGRDGDNWGLNNVVTGGAGAIGYRIKFNSIVAGLIRNLPKLWNEYEKID